MKRSTMWHSTNITRLTFFSSPVLYNSTKEGFWKLHHRDQPHTWSKCVQLLSDKESEIIGFGICCKAFAFSCIIFYMLFILLFSHAAQYYWSTTIIPAGLINTLHGDLNPSQRLETMFYFSCKQWVGISRWTLQSTSIVTLLRVKRMDLKIITKAMSELWSKAVCSPEYREDMKWH